MHKRHRWTPIELNIQFRPLSELGLSLEEACAIHELEISEGLEIHDITRQMLPGEFPTERYWVVVYFPETGMFESFYEDRLAQPEPASTPVEEAQLEIVEELSPEEHVEEDPELAAALENLLRESSED